jgi:hypothetical protein
LRARAAAVTATVAFADCAGAGTGHEDGTGRTLAAPIPRRYNGSLTPGAKKHVNSDVDGRTRATARFHAPVSSHVVDERSRASGVRRPQRATSARGAASQLCSGGSVRAVAGRADGWRGGLLALPRRATCDPWSPRAGAPGDCAGNNSTGGCTRADQRTRGEARARECELMHERQEQSGLRRRGRARATARMGYRQLTEAGSGAPARRSAGWI